MQQPHNLEKQKWSIPQQEERHGNFGPSPPTALQNLFPAATLRCFNLLNPLGACLADFQRYTAEAGRWHTSVCPLCLSW